jgi:tRNA A37 methylthiotransferase MiaB
MAVLSSLSQAGLAVAIKSNRLRVTPADRITADLRQFVRDHESELLAELIAADDPQAAAEPLQATSAPTPAPLASEAASEPRRNIWTITRGGRSTCTICSSPMTRGEALAEARWRWPDANIMKE